ncbi:helix-turn-helix transcriptional regulator [Pseudodesulfovibrio sp.]|uniref:helix-turn-helix transcriptional regulator n=1 Tax=unclassified Pseudodesulfovibrio TaxID=2661612 RepID=UPI003B00B97B
MSNKGNRKLIDEHEAARLLCISVSKIRTDRQNGIGLPYVKNGRSVRYDIKDIDEFIENQKVTPPQTY